MKPEELEDKLLTEIDMKKIDWKINWRKLKYIPKSTGLRILMLATGLAEVLFLALLLVLNVLPALYIVLIIAAILLNVIIQRSADKRNLKGRDI